MAVLEEGAAENRADNRQLLNKLAEERAWRSIIDRVVRVVMSQLETLMKRVLADESS